MSTQTITMTDDRCQILYEYQQQHHGNSNTKVSRKNKGNPSGSYSGTEDISSGGNENNSTMEKTKKCACALM